jgi:hypothetical protein
LALPDHAQQEQSKVAVSVVLLEQRNDILRQIGLGEPLDAAVIHY